jgi:hypothetical protein
MEILDGEIIAPGERQRIGQLKESMGIRDHQQGADHVPAVLGDRGRQFLPARVGHAVVVPKIPRRWISDLKDGHFGLFTVSV